MSTLPPRTVSLPLTLLKVIVSNSTCFMSACMAKSMFLGTMSSEPSPLVAVAVVSAATAVVSVADDMKSFRLRWFERRLRVPRNVEPFSA